MVPDGPNQLWVADITCVAIATGFVYVAVILDAWSRRVVGYAIGRSNDVRLTAQAQNCGLIVSTDRGALQRSCANWRNEGHSPFGHSFAKGGVGPALEPYG